MLYKLTGRRMFEAVTTISAAASRPPQPNEQFHESSSGIASCGLAPAPKRAQPFSAGPSPAQAAQAFTSRLGLGRLGTSLPFLIDSCLAMAALVNLKLNVKKRHGDQEHITSNYHILSYSIIFHDIPNALCCKSSLSSITS